MPKKHQPKKSRSRSASPSNSDVLDVGGIAALLRVSIDTVYDLLGSGELPGRKVGRKWRTTRGVVLRWMEHSISSDTAHRATQRAIETGDKAALSKALQSGAVRVKTG